MRYGSVKATAEESQDLSRHDLVQLLTGGETEAHRDYTDLPAKIETFVGD